MVNSLLITISIMIAFGLGFEFGRLYRRLQAYLASIRAMLRNHPAELKRAADHSPGVVVPNKASAPTLPTDLSEDSGGVLPMSPRGVALEEARLARGEL